MLKKKKTLNVGAGERTYKFYPDSGFECINMDKRKLAGIDVVGDISDLNMFKNEEFDFILASDIIEHFPIAKTQQVLNEWKRVLKPGGQIEFKLPNLKKLCAKYFKDGRNARDISYRLYGGQDYPGNFHFVCFDRKLFGEECAKAGLIEEAYKEEECNMIVTCRKPVKGEAAVKKTTILKKLLDIVKTSIAC